MAAGSDTPIWRQGFDAVEREVSPRLEALVQSEQFAVVVGVAARLQRTAQEQMSRSTRRILHGMNLPAGSDVTRILNELGQLRRQVRELSSQLDVTKAELARATADAPVPRTPTAAKAAGKAAKRPARRRSNAPAARADGKGR